MHNKEISLVEVGVFFFKKEDKYYSDLLEDMDHTYPNWEDCTKEITEDEIKGPFKDNDIIFTEDCYGFTFTFIGENFDSSYHGGCHWEYCEGYEEGFFEGAIEDFIKWGKEKLEKFNEQQKFMKTPYKTNFVRFITAWDWTSYEDSYNHEWESEWNLLGLVNLEDIIKIVK